MGQQLYRIPPHIRATVETGETLRRKQGRGETSVLVGKHAVPLSVLGGLTLYHSQLGLRMATKAAQDPGDHISMLTHGGQAGAQWARDMVMRDTVGPMYVYRPVMNAPDIISWARANGFSSTLTADDLHVTIVYSREPVDWSVVGCDPDLLSVPAGPDRSLRLFDSGAVVLTFGSPQLQARWQAARAAGASWDYPDYRPHITLSYNPLIGMEEVPPYDGPILLGPEVAEPLNPEWRDQLVEKMLRHEDGKWRVYDHEGEKLLGEYDTEGSGSGAPGADRSAQEELDGELHATDLQGWGFSGLGAVGQGVDPDQPRDDNGQWSGGGGGGGGGGGDASFSSMSYSDTRLARMSARELSRAIYHADTSGTEEERRVLYREAQRRYDAENPPAPKPASTERQSLPPPDQLPPWAFSRDSTSRGRGRGRSRKSEDGDVGQDFETAARVVKVDEGLGLVMGYAIVCNKDGKPYYDLQGDHIPEDAMLKAATDFMANSRAAKDMHSGDAVGDVVFAFPLTTDIAKAFGLTTSTTGLMIAMRPGPEMMAKFRSGDYTGFSIGGRRIVDEEVD